MLKCFSNVTFSTFKGLRGGRPSEREGTGVPRADDSPLFQGIGRQSGALGLLSGDAATVLACCRNGQMDSRWDVGGDVSKEESLYRRRGKEGRGKWTRSDGLLPFYPAEVMVAERSRVEQG